jgi:hypothetical protein
MEVNPGGSSGRRPDGTGWTWNNHQEQKTPTSRTTRTRPKDEDGKGSFLEIDIKARISRQHRWDNHTRIYSSFLVRSSPRGVIYDLTKKLN